MITEQDERVSRLIAKGRQQGSLTTDDILEVVPRPEESVDELEDLYSHLAAAGVRVIGGDAWLTTALARAGDDAAGSPIDGALDLSLDINDEGIDDPVRM